MQLEYLISELSSLTPPHNLHPLIESITLSIISHKLFDSLLINLSSYTEQYLKGLIPANTLHMQCFNNFTIFGKFYEQEFIIIILLNEMNYTRQEPFFSNNKNVIDHLTLCNKI